MRKAGNAYQNLLGPITVGTPTGGYQAAGSINAQGLFVNGVAVSGGAAVASVTGTANQVTASPTTGAVVVGLPQNVIIPTPTSGVALAVNGVSGSQTITVSGNGGTSSVATLSDTTNTNGAGLLLVGNGGATPNKTIRVAGGVFGILNSAYSALLLSLNDSGALTTTSTAGNTAQFLSSGVAANVSVFAPSTFSATFNVGGNGNAVGASLALQQDSSGINAFIRNLSTGSLSLGVGATNYINIGAAGNVTVSAPISGVALTVSGFSGTHSTKIADSATNSFNAGFLEIPQNSQSAAYTTVRSDSGKHIYHPSADTTARTWTIDSNANVPYPIGTAITFDNDTSAGVITLAITTDTLVWLPTGTLGSRSIAPNGQATALKVTATRWHLTGVGLS